MNWPLFLWLLAMVAAFEAGSIWRAIGGKRPQFARGRWVEARNAAEAATMARALWPLAPAVKARRVAESLWEIAPVGKPPAEDLWRRGARAGKKRGR
jgi:hypothetical protein